ncbi:NETI motif-containing protein [Pseudalkalibacillus berkeleyi]|uniref:NETI motif-containing protein n=1 Tax=Pseudalkalibacillus berkeleyi TaxID=1069813 RepID=A0ABS9H5F9_9BACL|nr:NETI motif-containing protein [Pseudalkalibacillus berkeleyi]MCF6139131.1 NETI motif-containing protein [Pseudalkalibacillus berkeleyi]
MDKGKPKKKKFEVLENESISDCLDRMQKEGYMPVRRMEEPVFQEKTKNNKKDVEYLRQKVVFEGKLQ